MLIEVIATFSCDRCGKKIAVAIDAGYEPEPERCSVFDIAEDALNSTVEYNPNGALCCLAQNNKHLCGLCNKWYKKSQRGE